MWAKPFAAPPPNTSAIFGGGTMIGGGGGGTGSGVGSAGGSVGRETLADSWDVTVGFAFSVGCEAHPANTQASTYSK